MWEPEGNKIGQDKLGSLEPKEILYEFAGEPLTFVADDPDGEPLLLHSLLAVDRISRYLVSAIDSRILRDLKAGRIDILSALRQPRCWIADVADDATINTVWRIEFASVPEKVLPRPGAMINPALDPLFRLRLIGGGVGPGKTSAADVRMAAQAAELGLRGLARVALDEKKKSGQVPKDIRYYPDLPYLFSRAASFEIAFGRPHDRLPGLDDEVFAEMGRLLERGLKALRANSETPVAIEGLDADQTVQLFEAIKALTPPTRGAVDRVEIGGELVDELSGSRVLTRDDRVRSVQRIKASRKAPRKEAPFRISGVIEEADQGTLCFTLRQLDPSDVAVVGNVTEIPFRFDEHLYDTVMEAFNSLERMVVVGERVDSRYEALDIKLAVDAADAGSEPESSGLK
jgi:hypothetical protein